MPPVLAAGAILVLLQGASPASAPSGGARLDEERALAREIRDDAMLRSVRELVALGPRMGGTTSGAKAAEWAAARFREAGAAVEVVEDPPTATHEEHRWSVEVEGEGPLRSAVPFGFSPTANGSGRLVTEAAGSGPRVLLVRKVPATAPGDGVLALLVDGSGIEGTGFVALRALPRDAFRVPVFGVAGGDGARLRAALAKGEVATIRFSLDATIREAAPRTVVATVPGRDRARRILFCAHGDADSGGPGADDNASGVAVVVELARAFARRAAAGDAPPCDLGFAVWGTEIHSTEAFVRRETDAGRWESLEAVVNFDQPGFGSGDDAVFVEPDDVPRNAPLVRALLEAAADHRGSAGFPARFTSNRALGGTDSYVFQNERRTPFPASITVFASAFGAPSEVDPTPGFPRGGEWGRRIRVDHDRFYHSSGDLPENTTEREPFNMGWCARVAAVGVRRFASSRR